MFYDNSYWGMNIIWWFLWVSLLFWIFFTPYDIPYQRKKRGTALDILQKRFASGQIDLEEYNEKKKTLMNDLAN